MSRKGKLPIELPKDVKVTVSPKTVTVVGPKGTLEQNLLPCIEVVVEQESILVKLREGSEELKKFHGLYRTLIENMVIGVTKGFAKHLEMIGVGYRANVQGKMLDLQVGVSHPLQLEIPEGIAVTVTKNTQIALEGANKQLLGQFAALVRSKRPPEPYQGKGIRYKGEYVRRKAGKSAKK